LEESSPTSISDALVKHHEAFQGVCGVIEHCLQGKKPESFFYSFPDMVTLGERTGVKFRLGANVMVKVARVDLDDKKIDFELIQKKTNGSKAGKKEKSGGKKRKK
jgi:hypothetical protein